MSKPLRILLSSYRSSPHVGGQGVFLQHKSRALAAQGHKVDVISGPPYPELDENIGLIKLPSLDMYARDNPITCLNREIMSNRLDLFEWWSHNWGGFPEPYTFCERLATYMQDKTDHYDIVHDNQSLGYGLLQLQAQGIPVVGTIHHPITRDRAVDIAHVRNPFTKFLKWRWYHFIHMQMKVAQALTPIMTVSHSTFRDAQDQFGLKPEQMRCIHIGIDHETFTPQPHIKRKENSLLAVASADVPLKGLIYLLRAYAELLPQHPDLELNIVGRLREGPTMQAVKKLGIRDKVNFLSDLSVHDILKLYAQASIVISPSVYEGFGLPAGEALACGAPVIATNGGALPEVVGDAGIIVPHSDSMALAHAIADLLNNPQKRAQLSAHARTHILNNFTWESCARNLTALYHETLDGWKTICTP